MCHNIRSTRMVILIFSAAMILDIFRASFVDATNNVGHKQFVTKYLEKYGYIMSSKNNSEFNGGTLKSGIKSYQLTYGLPVTGRVDNSTLRVMMRPRCGVTDLGMRRSRSGRSPAADGTRQSEFKFFDGSSRKWGKGDLLYRYEFNEESPRGIDYEAAILRAFLRWEGVCQYFNFRQLADYDIPSPPERAGDIHIGWFAGDHGDGAPFDGRGGTVAHALPPPAGVMHFDADELWSAGESGGDEESVPVRELVDLETVAVHEIGHLLGLDHTDVKEAVMYAEIGPGEVKRDLHSDDIQGIRALYPFCNFGERKGSH